MCTSDCCYYDINSTTADYANTIRRVLCAQERVEVGFRQRQGVPAGSGEAEFLRGREPNASCRPG